MDLTKLMYQIKDFDNKVRDSYEEIESTVFKGRDIKDIVTVDMFGNFVVDKININPKIIKNLDKETLEAIKDAVNDAISAIKNERNAIIKEEIYKKMKGNIS